MKIVGERAMVQFLDGVDDLRKAKIMEFFEKAEIKARQRPVARAPAGPGKKSAGTSVVVGGPSASGATARPNSMRPPASQNKIAPLKRPTSTISVDKDVPESPKRPTSIARPGVKPPGSGVQAPSRLTARQSLAPSVRTASPPPPPAVSATTKKPVLDDAPMAAPKLARGLLGRVHPEIMKIGLICRIYLVRLNRQCRIPNVRSWIF